MSSAFTNGGFLREVDEPVRAAGRPLLLATGLRAAAHERGASTSISEPADQRRIAKNTFTLFEHRNFSAVPPE